MNPPESTVGERLAVAVSLHRANNIDAAAAIYREVLLQEPNNPDALHLLGMTSQLRGDPIEGEALIRRAVALRPNEPVFARTLGKCLAQQEKWPEAAECYRRLIQLTPGEAEAYYDLGIALLAVADRSGAAAVCDAARNLHASAGARAKLGSVLRQLMRYDEALAVLREALAHDAGNVQALASFAYLQMVLGDFAGARASYHRAIAVAPHDPNLFRLYLTCLLYDPGIDNASRHAEHLRFSRTFAPVATQIRASTAPDPDRPLRIGWLSSDLSNHPVARNLEPLFSHRNKELFAAIVYSGAPGSDATTERFRNMADSWRPVAGWSDSRVAERIRADRIDILMVLAGRFDDNRPLVAAYGPAPVQMSLYDAATSGLAAMNYFIADSAMSPRSTSEEFAERVLRLPNFYVHAPIVDSPEVGRSPIESRGHVTFGCFNNPLKINERVLKTWARILVRLPNARLTLKYINMYQSTALRDRVDGTLSREGVDPGRVWMIEESQSARDHLQQHADIDIALDPFPFTGSTSTFEALWMGVPVVSLSGENFMARWTPSMLKKVGLQELVARTPDDYVDLAVHLATDIPRLTGLRARLRPTLANSVLCDARRTMRYLERSQRAVWRRWCAAQRAG